ncbi:MAG: LexA family transcriptional regulator [Oscillospiraceae bacterium]|nr:LexA family transcriptional regulator [Oscillospiraceae bacterium]
MNYLFKQLRRENSLTQAELASALGVHQTAVSQWECGHTFPDTATLARLSDFYNVSTDILMGRPSMGEYIELPPEQAVPGEHFAMLARGNSMQPRIFDGDTVIVRRQSEVRHGEIAVLKIRNEELTIKKVVKRGRQQLFYPLNEAYEPIVFTDEQIRTLPVTILGKVVELRAKL